MLKAGIGLKKITPQLGIELWGYGYYLNRRATGINDDLCARCIELDDGKNKIMIISCDLGGIGRNFVQKCKEEISKLLGITKDNISICATHTHAGPATVYMRALGEIDKNYLIFLKEKIVESAINADKDLEEVRIGAGKGKCEIGLNRVVRDGLIDKELLVLRIDNMSKETKAILYNCSVHPVNGGGKNLLISADWPGYTNKIIEEKNCTPIFLQGSCGDINVKDAGIFEKAKENGEELAREILNVQENIKFESDLKLEMKTEIVNLPLDVPDKKRIAESRLSGREEIVESEGFKESRKRAGFEKFIQEWKEEKSIEISRNPRDFLPAEIQFIRIGEDICFIFQPSELFTKWQLRIKEISGCKHTFVVGYANDYIGYIPDEDDFKRNGYAAFIVPMITGFFHFKKEVGEVLLKEVKKILTKGE